ncbi:MAG: TRAP transporter substrate-binding protein [Deltaproteobacteria bacterium]|nr:TRAP transporter substrate-binding protein [Deltaproteobacteria bacterium]
MKKRIVAFVLMLPVAVFMLAAASRAKPIVLKFSDINAKKSAAGVFCEKFAELTEKKTEGRVKIQTYYGGTLTGNDIEGTQTGIADFSQHDVSEVTDLCPFLSILEAPFMYKNDEQLYKITAPDSPIFKRINECLKGSGVLLATTYSWGPQNILTTKTPVYRQEDLKGLKIRVLPSKIFMETMKAMGATPTPMSWGEVITSLVTGVIDGTGMPFCYVVPAGLHEIQKYYILTRHNPTLSGVFMNEAAWHRLSPEDQRHVLEAGAEARYSVTRYIRDNNEGFRKQMLEKGMTIIGPDQLSFDAVKIRETVFQKYKDDWGDLYGEILKILEE